MTQPRIKDIRKALGMRQVELADRLGIDQGWLSRMEAGKSNTTVSMLERIAEALDVKVFDLFREETVIDVVGQLKNNRMETPKSIENLEIQDAIALPIARPGVDFFAVKVDTDTTYPFAHAGDFLVYQKSAEPIPKNAIGRSCLCEIERSSSGSVYQTGVPVPNESGGWNLVSMSPLRPPELDCDLFSVHRIIAAIPADLLEKSPLS
ncbi:MAG: helix-turn-helix transcriptional regulator [Pseudomonadota bacterium]